MNIFTPIPDEAAERATRLAGRRLRCDVLNIFRDGRVETTASELLIRTVERIDFNR